MKKWENPIDFDIKQSCGEDILLYENLMETGQGGPVIGDLSINGKPISGYRFGGPVLCDEKNIYAPVFIRRFFVRGFKLGIIDRVSLSVSLLGTAKGVIFLDRIEEGKIYFFEDVFRIKENLYVL